MATFTITVPNALVPVLTAAADEYLDGKQIDRTGMTAAQRGQRYIAEVLRDVYVRRQRASAESTAQATVTTTVTQATTDAAGIV